MTNDVIAQLVRTLGESCGFGLDLIGGSVMADGDYIAATARSTARAPTTRQVNIDVLARILIAPDEAGVPGTWALLFFYVNGARVAPVGVSHMRLEAGRDVSGTPRWVAAGWEADEYDEWGEFERLDDS